MFILINLVTVKPSVDVILAVMFATPLVVFTLKVLLALPAESVMTVKLVRVPYFGSATANWTVAPMYGISMCVHESNLMQ